MNSVCRDALLRELSDGEIHSGAGLAHALNRSRTAVWKHIQHLRDLGLEVESLPGRGYRLSRRFEFLDAGRIERYLDRRSAQALDSLEVVSTVDSTNDRLKRMATTKSGQMNVLLAEFQTGGRGRRGRSWLSPFGSGLCLSLSWRYETAPPGFSALGLAAGTAVRQALCDIGAAELKLKWPNDIVTCNGKVAGLLVDVDGESAGPLNIVVGVGVNMYITDKLIKGVSETRGLAPVGLSSVVSDGLSRNRVAARIIDGLRHTLVGFAESGFTFCAADWRRHDYLYGRSIKVQAGAEIHEGIGRGIAADGSLLLESAAGLLSMHSGEVTLTAM
jgi:BirA family biotin operon repressor/biotin-[acetyl-CoA-carboxylase] ligase